MTKGPRRSLGEPAGWLLKAAVPTRRDRSPKCCAQTSEEFNCVLRLSVLSSRRKQSPPATHDVLIRPAIRNSIIQQQDDVQVIVEDGKPSNIDGENPSQFFQRLSLPPSPTPSSLTLSVAQLLPLLPMLATVPTQKRPPQHRESVDRTKTNRTFRKRFHSASDPANTLIRPSATFSPWKGEKGFPVNPEQLSDQTIATFQPRDAKITWCFRGRLDTNTCGSFLVGLTQDVFALHKSSQEWL